MLKWLKSKFRQPWREMSMGELADKISILMVKKAKLTSSHPEWNMLSRQREYLFKSFYNYCCDNLENIDEVMALTWTLFENNFQQWDYEDQVLTLDGEAGLAAAKKSRQYNQTRAVLKRKIDLLFNEKYLEVKQYAS